MPYPYSNWTHERRRECTLEHLRGRRERERERERGNFSFSWWSPCREPWYSETRTSKGVYSHGKEVAPSSQEGLPWCKIGSMHSEASVEALQDIPQEARTEEASMQAVLANGLALQHVPNELRTPEICMAAVKSAWRAVSFVPEGKHTEELCLAAVQTRHAREALKMIPQGARTEAVCMAAVESSAGALTSVPPETLTMEMCMTAVYKEGMALYFVPVEYRTDTVCKAAVDQDWKALQYVPQDVRSITEEMLMARLKLKEQSEFTSSEKEWENELQYRKNIEENISNVVMTLKWIPKERLTIEHCWEAMQSVDIYLIQGSPKGPTTSVFTIGSDLFSREAGLMPVSELTAPELYENPSRIPALNTAEQSLIPDKYLKELQTRREQLRRESEKEDDSDA